MSRFFIVVALSFFVSSLHAQGVLTEEVTFSRSSGFISAPEVLDVVSPATQGAGVRFTTDNSEPTAASTLWTGPLTITTSAVIRARVVAQDGSLGPVKSRHLIRLDPSLVSYRTTKKPFSSNLPIVVIEPFGADIDNNRLPQLSYTVTIRPDPVTKRASLLGPTDYQGRSTLHQRGETSSGFDQRPYAWETIDETGADKAVSLLGMPEESDWVLYAPYTDKTLMRNELVYSRMRSLRGDGSAMRAEYCEVFVNNDPNTPLSMDDYRGVYVLMEKIKRDSERVSLAKLNSTDTDPALISGGYIFRKDKPSATNYAFMTGVLGMELQLVEPSVPNVPQASYLETYVSDFENALYGQNFVSPDSGYAAYIDPLTFIDNQWFVEITKQIDGYRLSTYFSKDRGRKVKALPLWDYNLSMGNADYLTGEDPRGWYHDQLGDGDYHWFKRLHEDPAYHLAYWDRYWELRRGVFSNPAILKEISARRSRLLGGRAEAVTNTTSLAIQTPVARHYRRWPILGTYVWPNAPGYDKRKTFQSEVSAMSLFLTNRLGWIDQQNAVNNVIFRPPNLSRPTSRVVSGSLVSISRFNTTAPKGFRFATGQIYYTTDDSDPRGADGTPHGSLYTKALRIAQTQTLKARLYDGTTWSPLAKATYVVSAIAPAATNIAINEVMYHAAPPSVDEVAHGFTTDSDFDWLELANFSTKPVNLAELKLTAGIGFDFTQLPASARSLAPGETALLVANKDAFAYRYASTPASRLLGEYTSTLSNSGETLTLTTSLGTVISSFTYNDSASWPDADGTGRSLQQVNPAGRANLNLPTSWQASAVSGGTPGIK